MEDFTSLADQYQPMIHKIIHSLHIYKNHDEFYQIGLIALWNAQNNYYEEKGNFSSFAYTWVKGKMISEMAKDRKHSERYIYPEEEFWKIAIDEAEVTNLEEEFLQTYGESLSEKEKKWLIMACFTGLSLKEIAEREHVTISAVKQWGTNARKKLREQMNSL
jgi:DNA-directed RNA polymerase